MLYGSEIRWCVISSNPDLVVTKHHVHDPVQAVFDRPVAAYGRPQKSRQHHQRRDVVACFPLDFSADFTTALNDSHSFETRPLMALLEPVDVVDDGRGSGLDAAMVAVDRRILADFGVGEAFGLLLGDEQFDVIAQRTLVAFQGEDTGESGEGFRM